MQKPLPQYITQFLEYCEIEKGLSQNTAKNYARFLKVFFDWLKTEGFSDLSPAKLTEEHISLYRLWLSRLPNKVRKANVGLNKSTQIRYLIALRALLAFFHEKNIESLPTEKVKLPKENRERQVKFLSLEQVEKLFDAVDSNSDSGLRDRAILESLFSTGMRVAELVALDRKQLESAKIDEDFEVSIIGKGSYPRAIYFSPRSLTWIKKYLNARTDDDPALFIRYAGPKSQTLRLTAKSIEQIVQKHARLAGIPVLATPHTLRHSFATDLLNEGVDIRMVQEFLGHRNIATTQVYTHVTNKRLKDIHKKYHGGQKLDDTK